MRTNRFGLTPNGTVRDFFKCPSCGLTAKDYDGNPVKVKIQRSMSGKCTSCGEPIEVSLVTSGSKRGLKALIVTPEVIEQTA